MALGDINQDVNGLTQQEENAETMIKLDSFEDIYKTYKPTTTLENKPSTTSTIRESNNVATYVVPAPNRAPTSVCTSITTTVPAPTADYKNLNVRYSHFRIASGQMSSKQGKPPDSYDDLCPGANSDGSCAYGGPGCVTFVEDCPDDTDDQCTSTTGLYGNSLSREQNDGECSCYSYGQISQAGPSQMYCNCSDSNETMRSDEQSLQSQMSMAVQSSQDIQGYQRSREGSYIMDQNGSYSSAEEAGQSQQMMRGMGSAPMCMCPPPPTMNMGMSYAPVGQMGGMAGGGVAGGGMTCGGMAGGGMAGMGGGMGAMTMGCCPMQSMPAECPPNCMDVEQFIRQYVQSQQPCMPNCLTLPVPPCLGGQIRGAQMGGAQMGGAQMGGVQMGGAQMGGAQMSAPMSAPMAAPMAAPMTAQMIDPSCCGQCCPGMAQVQMQGQNPTGSFVNDTLQTQTVYTTDYRPFNGLGNSFQHYPNVNSGAGGGLCGGGLGNGGMAMDMASCGLAGGGVGMSMDMGAGGGCAYYSLPPGGSVSLGNGMCGDLCGGQAPGSYAISNCVCNPLTCMPNQCATYCSPMPMSSCCRPMSAMNDCGNNCN